MAMERAEQELLKQIAGDLRGLYQVADVIKTDLAEAVKLLREIDGKISAPPPTEHPR